MRIVHCQTNHMTSPLGFAMEKAVFSWQVEDARGTHQKAARICISLFYDMHELLYDSGAVEDADSLGTEAPVSLMPRTRYYWTVSVRSNLNETAVSPVSFFETGKRDERWQAKWISCPDNGRHPVFHKDISVDGKLASARLYICGLGVYEAEINGERVGDEYLTPYCNDYRRWLQAQTFDVTKQLENGGLLSVTLGKGWYAGRFGYFSKPGDPGCYGKDWKLIAEIHLNYADGRENVIGTDETWTVTRSTITDSSIYDGEMRDDTLPETETEAAFLVEEDTPLVDRYSLPVRVQEERKPEQLLHTPAGELVLDLGQNLTGSFSLRVKEPAGTKIHLQVGEVLQNDCFYNENLRTAKAEYWYTSNGEEVLLEPKFTFYGYRYVKVEGIPDLKKDDFTALVLYSDLPGAGKLTTGNAKVNRLIQNVEWGQKGNFLDVPTDCPQRDERLGWTGDAQVFSATACYLTESYAFYRKYLHDMGEEQKDLDGMVPDIVPSLDKRYQSTAGVWGDAACIIPWNLYCFYGDRTILEEQFESMKAWVDYIRRKDGDHHGWDEQFQYGDWLALDHPSGAADQCLGGTDERYIARIYYRNSARIVAKAAKLLGRKAEEEEYNSLADRLTEEIRTEYFSPAGRCCADTQTGLVLALQNDLSPDPEKCRTRLAEKLRQSNGKLQTGFVGTPFLCHVLSRNGMEGQAYSLLLNEEYPGWLYEVNLGATTIWERWNSMNPDGSVSSTGMNSFNHYSYGSIARWLCADAAGLQPVEDQPGFRTVVLSPIPDARLGKMELEYHSAAGRYSVFWKTRDMNTLHLKVSIPFDCEAMLYLPYAPEELFAEENPLFQEVADGVCYLHAGDYEITYHTTRPMGICMSADDFVHVLLADKVITRALEEVLPGISNTPDALRNKSLRQLMIERMDATEELIEKADSAVKNAYAV